MGDVRQPAGSVTLVFTDIEGSTRLLEELGVASYREALAEHRRIVREACSRYAGYEVDYEGDAFFFAFPSAEGAVSAISEAMAGLAEGPIRIRVGMHTGEPELDPPKYVGFDVHLAARVASSAHGGQVVLTQSTRASVGDRFPLRELGEHRLKDVAAPVTIYQLGDETFPPLKTISNTNLPRPASSFVGREHELADVLSRVQAGARLLTLTGPGGSGKTRLAIEAAASLVPAFRAGVFWVGLAALRDPELVTETIAQTLGAKDGLAGHIGEREMLLLLDNLEQVIEAAPELASLLEACPRLTLLVTSRELLRVRGEVEYKVPPLAQREAIDLFCARSQLPPSDDIAELCARLDNLPLAVELAAARTAALTPAQIVDRLSQRLDLLKGGRDADPRQQTLRATIEWSYDLLTEEEQRLFRALSVFAGGCTLEASEEVADADLDALQSLVEKSLLRFTQSDSGGRYWMLETIREYAGERLATSGFVEELQRRHGRYFLIWAERGEEELRRSIEWLDDIAREHDNVRQALDWAAGESEWALAMRAVWGLWRFWVNRGHLDEGRRWAERVVASGHDVDALVRARALVGAGELAMRQGDVERAWAYKEEHIALFRTLGRAEELARSLASLGNLAAGKGEFVQSRSLFEEALEIHRRRGDDFGIAHTTAGLAYLAAAHGDLELAKRRYEDAVALFRRTQSREYIALALTSLGEILVTLDDLAEARRVLTEALLMSLEDDVELQKLDCLEQFARLAAAEGDGLRAATLWGAAEALARTIGLARLDEDRGPFLEQAQRALSPPQFAAAWERGAALEANAAVAFALEHFGGAPASPEA